MKRNPTLYLARGGLIAALYVCLTYLSFMFGMASGDIQFRISELLCVLPAFLPEAIPGLFIGCILANALTGSMLIDVVLGSLATLIGAIGAYLLRSCRFKWLIPLPTVIANALVVPFVLVITTGPEAGFAAFPMFALTVFIGEFVCAGVGGYILYVALDKNRRLFRLPGGKVASAPEKDSDDGSKESTGGEDDAKSGSDDAGNADSDAANGDVDAAGENAGAHRQDSGAQGDESNKT